MRFPPIAALTRVEAKAARDVRASFVEAEAHLGEEGFRGAENRELVDAMVFALDSAISEYEGRPWMTRWRRRPDEHRTRLRAWLIETLPLVKARVGEVDVPE
jgi:hypothetical protein